jgi:HTH-type transcriptional regulator, competence development regulator
MKLKNRTLGQFLKALRQDQDLTLRGVEELTGISNAYLSQLEGDKIKQPSPVVLHKLSKLYKSSYPTLLGLAGYPVPDTETVAEGSLLAARIGPVTTEEENEIVEYLGFLRSRRKKDGSRR